LAVTKDLLFGPHAIFETRSRKDRFTFPPSSLANAASRSSLAALDRAADFLVRACFKNGVILGSGLGLAVTKDLLFGPRHF